MSKKKKHNSHTRKPLTGGLGGGSPGPLVPEVVTSPAAEIDERTPGKDLKLIQSAVNNGWKIRPAAMSALPDAMLRIALDGATEVRARVSAAKVLCTMYGQSAEGRQGSTVNVGVVVNNGDEKYKFFE